jgi:hypothetical protein
MPNRFSTRFEELTAEAIKLEASKRSVYDEYESRAVERIDTELLAKWRTQAKHLIGSTCGEDSHYMKEFVDAGTASSWAGPAERLRRMMAVFAAAREDFDGGYITSVRSLVQAEVFGTELEQASELLQSKYKVAAAVIAGIVLETALRELCDRNQIQHGKMDKMNADLAKKGTYNLLMQKRITALAQIRNDAAHGKPDQFTDADVTAMIADVERFLGDFLR